jgi:AcrR family transcriptional regulator
MESIARAAGVTKELIYHYFRGKEDIFNEVRTLQRADALAASGADENMLSAADSLAQPELLFVWRFHRALTDLEWVRFLTWEAAQGKESGIPGEGERQRTIRKSISAIKTAQEDGRLAEGLDPDLLQLAVFALANYPLAFAQITKMATGRSPSDPTFRKDWSAFLAELGKRVLAVEKAPLKRKPRAKTPQEDVAPSVRPAAKKRDVPAAKTPVKRARSKTTD